MSEAMIQEAETLCRKSAVDRIFGFCSTLSEVE
jgi:hypothetical protein